MEQILARLLAEMKAVLVNMGSKENETRNKNHGYLARRYEGLTKRKDGLPESDGGLSRNDGGLPEEEGANLRRK
jgi:hypothetical protein